MKGPILECHATISGAAVRKIPTLPRRRKPGGLCTPGKTFKIELSSAAQRQLRKLDPHIGKQIYADIQKLAANPRPLNYEQLATPKLKLFRVPVGPKKNYRVVYEVDDEMLVVLVLKVGDRKEIYR